VQKWEREKREKGKRKKGKRKKGKNCKREKKNKIEFINQRRPAPPNVRLGCAELLLLNDDCEFVIGCEFVNVDCC
jgi:hypothetical protein